MDAYGGFPMVMTDKMRRVGQNYDRIRDLVDEYWHPIRDWHFNEYLGESIVVVEEITHSPILAIGSRMQYELDREIANRLFR